MLVAAITWPLFTHITFSFFLFNLILEKLFSVESGRFFLALTSWGFFVVGVVVAVGGSLCYYTFANQQSQDRKS